MQARIRRDVQRAVTGLFEGEKYIRTKKVKVEKLPVEQEEVSKLLGSKIK